jgi:hypothetical protein
MSKIILYTADANAATGIREATLDEIMTGARHALSSHVRKGTVFSNPKITASYLTARLAFSDVPGRSCVLALARQRRPRGVTPVRLPDLGRGHPSIRCGVRTARGTNVARSAGASPRVIPLPRRVREGD